MPDGALVQTCNTVLPADVPPRFYLLVVGAVAAFIGVSVLSKALKFTAVIVSGVAVILAIITQLSGAVSSGP